MELFSISLILAIWAQSNNAVPMNRSMEPTFRNVGISDNLYIAQQNTSFGRVEQVCVVDNTVYYENDAVPTTSPCEQCVCKPPGFACNTVQCPTSQGCLRLEKRSPSQCCPQPSCDCESNGRRFTTGQKITDPALPCQVCYCQDGRIVCSTIRCFTRSDCQPVAPTAGRCCPSYDHCQIFPGRPFTPIRPLPMVFSKLVADQTPPSVDESTIPKTQATEETLVLSLQIQSSPIEIDVN